MKPRNVFFIGELAKQAQVTVDTIRYYEKIGLLPKPQRRSSGYRQYDTHTLDRLIFIKQAQELGLSLVEIGELLSFQKNDRFTCLKMQNLLTNKIKNIDQRIAALQNFRQILITHLAECNSVLSQNTDIICPIIEELPHVTIVTKRKA